MKYVFLFLLFYFHKFNVTGQINLSKIYPLPDSIFQYLQTPILKSMPGNKAIGLFSNLTKVIQLPYILSISANLDIESSRKSDDSFLPFIQVTSQDGLQVGSNNFLLAGDKQYEDVGIQAAFVQSYDLDLKPTWRFDLADQGIPSIGGIIIKNKVDTFTHLVLAYDTLTYKSYINFTKFTSDGTITIRKKIQLLLGTKDYNAVTDGALTATGYIFWLGYFDDDQNGAMYNLAAETDFDGNLIKLTPEAGAFRQVKFVESNMSTDYFSVRGRSSNSICVKKHTANYSVTTFDSCTTTTFQLAPTASRANKNGELFTCGSTYTGNGASLQTFGFLQKHDPTGKLLWIKYYKLQNPTKLQTFESFDFLDNGNIIVMGQLERNTIWHVWLLTLDNNGCFNGDCKETILIPETIVSTKQVSEPITSLELWPNPATNMIYLQTDAKGMFRIYNQVGRLCQETDFKEIGEHRVPIQTLSSGIYFCRLGNKTSKLVVIR
jgi:Secretion system C-terminal sorting domain